MVRCTNFFALRCGTIAPFGGIVGFGAGRGGNPNVTCGQVSGGSLTMGDFLIGRSLTTGNGVNKPYVKTCCATNRRRARSVFQSQPIEGGTHDECN